jgi:hypothetical protein
MYLQLNYPGDNEDTCHLPELDPVCNLTSFSLCNRGYLFCPLSFCKVDISTVYIDHSHSIWRAIMEDQAR